VVGRVWGGVGLGDERGERRDGDRVVGMRRGGRGERGKRLGGVVGVRDERVWMISSPFRVKGFK
jgi:hypothetical protein